MKQEIIESFEKKFVHKGEDCNDPPEKWTWTIKGSYPTEVKQFLSQSIDKAVNKALEGVRDLEPEIREILKNALYGTDKCLYCDFYTTTGRKVGMQRHIRVKHPDKFTDKVDRIMNLIKEIYE